MALRGCFLKCFSLWSNGFTVQRGVSLLVAFRGCNRDSGCSLINGDSRGMGCKGRDYRDIIAGLCCFSTVDCLGIVFVGLSALFCRKVNVVW